MNKLKINLLLLLVISISNLFAQTNLIKNGDFEIGTTTFWIPWLADKPASHLMEIVTTDLEVGGKKACKNFRRENKCSMFTGIDSTNFINSENYSRNLRVSFDFKNLDDTTYLKNVYPTIKITLKDGTKFYTDGRKAKYPKNNVWYHYSSVLSLESEEFNTNEINWAPDQTYLLLQLESDRIWNDNDKINYGKRVPILVDNIYLGFSEGSSEDSLYQYGTGITDYKNFNGVSPEFASHNTNNFYNVKDYGAISDGKVKNTEAFKKAIDACVLSGGGTVFVPAGKYLTGPIHLQSNINLHLAAGSTLIFSEDFGDYLPLVQSRFQGGEVQKFSAQIYANNAENVAITGRGIIDGQGKVWWDYFIERFEKFRNGEPVDTNKWSQIIINANKDKKLDQFGFLRPSITNFYECENVLIEGVTIQNSPSWTNHFIKCNNVVVTGVSIYNPISYNTDGLAIESSKNVRVSNCYFDTDDDCISIKAGKGKDYWKDGESSENITITNCTMVNGAAGVCVGSEMSGGVRDVTISNCVIDGTKVGLFIKSVRGRGGVVENIMANNLVINNMSKFSAIRLSAMYWFKTYPELLSERTPTFRNIFFSNISGRNNYQAIEVLGLEEKFIENVSFSNINLSSNIGVSVKYATDIKFNDVNIISKNDTVIDFNEMKNVKLSSVDFTSEDGSENKFLVNNVSNANMNNLNLFNKKINLSVSGEKTENVFISDVREHVTITYDQNKTKQKVKFIKE